MPILSTLTVRLSANSAQLVAEFGKAQKRARTFGDRMKGVARVASRAFVGLAAAAVPSLIAVGSAGIEAADNLAKTSAKLGISADQLAGLRFAAEQTGVGLKTLDLGLQRMVRRVAEAAKGTGEAQKAIKELGLDARVLAALSPDEQFRRIADAMQDVGSQSDKVRLGFKLFDSEGVGLVNTLAAGRGELNKFAEEARSFGLALTDRQLDNVQKAADAQNRVSKAFAGFSRQLGASLSPAIKIASDATASFISTITNSLPTWAAWASAILGVERNLKNLTLTELNAEALTLKNRIGDLVDQRDALLDIRERTGFNIEGVNPDGLDKVIENIGALTTRYQDVQAAITDLERISDRNGDGGVFAAIVPSAEQRAALSEVQQRWRAMATDLESFIQQQERSAASAASIFQQTRTPIENFMSRIREARDLLDKGFITDDTFDRYNRILSEGLVDPVKDAVDEVKEKGNELGLTFSSAFEDAIVEGNKFRDVLEGIYKDIIRIAARKFITEPLGNFFGGLFGGGQALGGPVAAGVPYMVGERGAELFVPSQNGTIIPNNKMGGGGGVVINQNINVDGSSDPVGTAAAVEAAAEIGANRALEKISRLRHQGRF